MPTDLDLELATRLSVPCLGAVCVQNREAVAKGLPAIDALDACQGSGWAWPLRKPCHDSWCNAVDGHAASRDSRRKCKTCAGRGWVPEMHLEVLLEVAEAAGFAWMGLSSFGWRFWSGPLPHHGFNADPKRALLKALRTVTP